MRGKRQFLLHFILILSLIISTPTLMSPVYANPTTTKLSADYYPFTRFYLPSSGAAAVSPAFDSEWNNQTGVDSLRCVTTRIVSTMISKISWDTSASSSFDVLTRQYVSDPLQAQTISGTVQGQIRTMENDAAADFMRAIVIKVVSNNGNWVRGILLSHFPTSLASEYYVSTSTLQNRNFPPSQALTTVTAIEGDRIVIEIGTRSFNTATTAYKATHSFGDNHASDDLPGDETATTAYNPWIGFSQNILFANPPTRLYLPSSGAAAVSPAFTGEWDNTAGVDRLKCVTTKTYSAMTSKTSSEAVKTSSYDVLTRQYVSDPLLQAQTISGTVKGQIRAMESSTDADFMRAIVIKVVSNDGNTVRGTLLSLFNTSLTSEYAITTATNRKFPPNSTLTSVDALANDRIVIEIGTRAFNTISATTYTATHSFGDDSATDLPESDTTPTSAYNPWIEFSQTILFASPTVFNININIKDVTDLFNFDFKLWYKTSFLTATAVTLGTFLRPGSLTWRNVINDTANYGYGYVWYAMSQSATETKGVNGSGTLATISFTVGALGASSLYLVDTILYDSAQPVGHLITHEVYDAYFANSPEVHDIALTSITPNVTTVIPGQTISVNVTARNHGTSQETFTVNAYAYPARFYLPSSGTAPVSPAFSGDWEGTSDADRLKFATTRINSAMTSKTSSETSSYSSYDVLTRQYVSDPLQAQTISGTVKGQIRAMESSTDADFMRAIVIKVVSNDGNTVRGTLLSLFNTSLTSEYAITTATNRKFPPNSTLTSVDALANDRIVIEIGTRPFNTATTSYTATHVFGDNSATDLPESESGTSAYNPWIAFSQTILGVGFSAARFYLPSSGAAAVNPAYSGEWDNTAGVDRLKCVTTRINSAMTSKTSSETSSYSSYDVLTRQYVSDPLQAQTISGTVKGQIRAQESSTDADFIRAIVIKVIKSDLTDRGVLLSLFPTSETAEYATSLTNRYFPPSQALTPVTALAGDRIVIEIGTRPFNTATTSYTATHSFGDNSDTDLPENEIGASAYNPWIEFSQNILFTDDTAIPIGTPTEVTLASGGRTTLTFTNTTTGLALGKYFISTNATTVSGETDTTDNTCNQAYDYDKKIFVYVTITAINYPEAVYTYSPTLQNTYKIVTFNASDSEPHGGEINKYEWDFGDGESATSSVLYPQNHRYNASNTYNVTLLIKDTEGLSDITWQLVTVTFASDIESPKQIVDIYDLAVMGKAYGKTGDQIADTTGPNETPPNSGLYLPDGKVDNVDLSLMGKEYGNSLPG